MKKRFKKDFGQSLVNFTGDSWSCLSIQNEGVKSKISNRCQHKAGVNETHILPRFSQQFSQDDPKEQPVEILNEEEWSVDSERFDSAIVNPMMIVRESSSMFPGGMAPQPIHLQ